MRPNPTMETKSRRGRHTAAWLAVLALALWAAATAVTAARTTAALPPLAQGQLPGMLSEDQPELFLSPTSAAQFAQPGEMVSFALQLQNQAHRAADTYDLSASSTWAVAFYGEDGAPLTDNDGDGQIDTGELAVRESTTILVRVTAPGDATAGDWSEATVTVRSSLDPSYTRTAALISAVAPAFAQPYAESWDPYGAIDGEAYLQVQHPDSTETAQLTFDPDEEAAPAVIRACGTVLDQQQAGKRSGLLLCLIDVDASGFPVPASSA